MTHRCKTLCILEWVSIATSGFNVVSLSVRRIHFTSTETPSLVADRTLKLVTKAVQNLANLVEFRAKEPFMVSLNDFIRRHLPKMKQFVNDISVSLCIKYIVDCVKPYKVNSFF